MARPGINGSRAAEGGVRDAGAARRAAFG